MARDKTHIVAMTGSYFRGDAEAVLHPEDEAKFHTVTYTYYEQLNGYQYLKNLDIGYYFYAGDNFDAIMEVLNPTEKTIRLQKPGFLTKLSVRSLNCRRNPVSSPAKVPRTKSGK